MAPARAANVSGSSARLYASKYGEKRCSGRWLAGAAETGTADAEPDIPTVAAMLVEAGKIS